MAHRVNTQHWEIKYLSFSCLWLCWASDGIKNECDCSTHATETFVSVRMCVVLNEFSFTRTVFPSLSSPVSRVSWLHRRANRRSQRAEPVQQVVPGIHRPLGVLPALAWRRAPRQPAAVWAVWRPQRWRGPRRPSHSSAACLARGYGVAPERPVAWETPAGLRLLPGSGWSNGGSRAPHCPPDPLWCERCPPERGCAPRCPWWLWWSHPSCHPVKIGRKPKEDFRQLVHLSSLISSSITSWSLVDHKFNPVSCYKGHSSVLFQFIARRSRNPWGASDRQTRHFIGNNHRNNTIV